MTLPLASTLTVLQWNTRLISSAAVLFTSLIFNAAKFSVLLTGVKRQLRARWYSELDNEVSERRKVIAAAHKSEKDR